MNLALWAAKTGLDAQNTQMAVIANNLANANTTGFKADRAAFQDLMYQNIQQVGAQSTQNTQYSTGLSLGTGVQHRRHREELPAGQRAADRRQPGHVDHRPGLLPDHDAGRHAVLHARRLVLAGLAGQRRDRERLSHLAGDHDPDHRAVGDHRLRRHGVGDDGRHVEGDDGRPDPARELHQCRGPAADRQQPADPSRPRAARRRSARRAPTDSAR